MSASIQYSNTPGVKVKEVSLLPPSVVQVASAIPVFLGYTYSGTPMEAKRIVSLKEYETLFGGPFAHDFTSFLGTNTLSQIQTLQFNLYENMRAYFANGGGACYIIPVGNYTAANASISATAFESGLDVVETLDEPTIIAFPEAIVLNDSDFAVVVNKAINLCNDLKDRMVLVDTPNGTKLTGPTNDLSDYRGLFSGNLSYASAYYPHVVASYAYTIDETATKMGGVSLSNLKSNGDQRYSQALTVLNALEMTLPPSAMIAGVYAKTDRERGVWKAPANVALQNVVRPVEVVSDSAQDLLNVDASTGKSINALRAFTGQGTVVWGARTLAGNSNEWRYIPVRRLFMTVEESVKKAVNQFVFDTNDAKTWVKVSSMISSYLNGLWKEGGLQGAKAEDAYFVQIGLGVTMTEQDILDGKMIVRIGLAAVRPAEFVLLEFSHYVRS